MGHRVHFRITDGAKVYHVVQAMDSVPAVRDKIWVCDNEGRFSGEVVIDSEFGDPTTEGEITHAYLYGHTVRYDD